MPNTTIISFLNNIPEAISAIAAAIAAIAAFISIKSTKKAAEAQILYSILKDYGSEDIDSSMRILYEYLKDDELLEIDSKKALDIAMANRKIYGFFFNCYKLYQNKNISINTIKHVCQLAGCRALIYYIEKEYKLGSIHYDKNFFYFYRNLMSKYSNE